MYIIKQLGRRRGQLANSLITIKTKQVRQGEEQGGAKGKEGERT